MTSYANWGLRKSSVETSPSASGSKGSDQDRRSRIYAGFIRFSLESLSMARVGGLDSPAFFDLIIAAEDHLETMMMGLSILQGLE